MVDINGNIAPTPAPTVYPATTPPPIQQSATSTASAEQGRQTGSAAGHGGGHGTGSDKSDPRKGEHNADMVVGFNPSARIDPDTHMVVLTIRDESGNTVRQIPTEHELAAYKAELSQHKK